MDYFYVTTPIYYVNDVPHIGHAYTTVAADVLARWHRLKGERVHFLTGTDEHGLKVARSAHAQGKTPQEWCDEIASRFQEAWDLLDISHDDFIRTTEDRHIAGVNLLLETLRDNGDLYLADYEGLYCVGCEDYYNPGELLDAEGVAGRGDLCPIHGRSVEHLKEQNWFFRWSKYADRLLAHIEANPHFVQPDTRRNEVVGFIKSGLQDVSFSRTAFDWGVPIPWDPTHVAYVWPDALTNYMSAVGYGSDPERFARDWPATVHIVGKEILRFHAVLWPAMLMSAGLPLPGQVFAHGWLLVEGEKMSKTAANKIHPAEIVDEFGVDCYRYYFLREVSFGPDGSFSWKSMRDRYNNDLANDLGNLASRILNMVERYLGGRAPAVPRAADGAEVDALRAALVDAVGALDARFLALDFDDGLAALWRFLHAANRFVEETEPWHLAKDGSDAGRARLADILGAGLETLRITAVLVSSVMPGAARRLWAKLGLPGEPDDAVLADAVVWGQFPEGTTVAKGEALFPRKDVAAETAGT